MDRVSLAGTGRTYRQAQARLWNDGRFHLQVAGNEVNRDYGLSLGLPMPSEGNDALSGGAVTRDSLAGSGKEYREVQFVMNGSTLHIQIEDGSGNRPYGFALDVAVGPDVQGQLEAV